MVVVAKWYKFVINGVNTTKEMYVTIFEEELTKQLTLRWFQKIVS